MNVETIVPLSMLRTGDRGRISDLEGSEEYVKRLCEMGLRHGAQIQMLRTGSPCIVAVDQQRLTLRTDEDVSILVELFRD
ncbi:MAG: FeoA domain-containing protein [Planctomycetales bacterium]